MIVELFVSHSDIKRNSYATFEGYGPQFDRSKKGKDLVRFYTSLLKVKDLLKDFTFAKTFQAMIDIYAHTDLMEII